MIASLVSDASDLEYVGILYSNFNHMLDRHILDGILLTKLIKQRTGFEYLGYSRNTTTAACGQIQAENSYLRVLLQIVEGSWGSDIDKEQVFVIKYPQRALGRNIGFAGSTGGSDQTRLDFSDRLFHFLRHFGHDVSNRLPFV